MKKKKKKKHISFLFCHHWILQNNVLEFMKFSNLQILRAENKSILNSDCSSAFQCGAHDFEAYASGSVWSLWWRIGCAQGYSLLLGFYFLLFWFYTIFWYLNYVKFVPAHSTCCCFCWHLIRFDLFSGWVIMDFPLYLAESQMEFYLFSILLVDETFHEPISIFLFEQCLTRS